MFRSSMAVNNSRMFLNPFLFQCASPSSSLHHARKYDYAAQSATLGDDEIKRGDLRLQGPWSGRGADGETRTRDRRVLTDVRADTLATVSRYHPPVREHVFSPTRPPCRANWKL
ncbi:hypothetical protein PoB_000650500 [Plakobranchus ocellatus]|uniref:Uncharacterized protein n=1 Tax=Plakobranchus ocellatus TaxID=259542 RepID=A0AAV3YA74_9GAST|nr:hypothetical protein PoB_000650500 [Plakobranchus ocellatus]